MCILTSLGTDFVIGYDLLSKGSRTAAELTLDLFNEHYGIFYFFLYLERPFLQY